MSSEIDVRLAGFNIDSYLIDKDSQLTPETISAAYARISRSPKTIPELRKQAILDVEAARSSNERIVFGLGHASVAEHAVFNFDVLGISRLALEALEARRFASFTEKSQRYVKMKGDFLIPHEIKGTPYEKLFRNTVESQFQAYRKTLEGLAAWYVKTGRVGDMKKARHMAKEDARYCLPLATLSQVGMTVNARTLEYLIKALAAGPLQEMHDLAKALYQPAERITPSLIRYVEPSRYDKRVRQAEFGALETKKAGAGPKLLRITGKGELLVIAALAQRVTGWPVDVDELENLSETRLKAFVLQVLDGLQVFDPLPREFEHAVITFQGVISAAAFGQLKRHRLLSLTAGPYNPDLGWMIPPVITDAGLEEGFKRVLDLAMDTWTHLKELGPAADYILPNAVQRPVIGTMNFREACHMARLRMDRHAQWDIRYFVTSLVGLIQENFPLIGNLLVGKDRFSGL